MQRRSRVVIDTGVLVSAFAFGGIPQKSVIKALDETEILVSPDILFEYREVPRVLLSGGKIDIIQFQSLISGIAAFVSGARVVYPTGKITLCRDPDDNMLLECCKSGRADYLITGDRDLLDIEGLPFNLQVVSPRSFLLV